MSTLEKSVDKDLKEKDKRIFKRRDGIIIKTYKRSIY